MDTFGDHIEFAENQTVLAFLLIEAVPSLDILLGFFGEIVEFGNFLFDLFLKSGNLMHDGNLIFKNYELNFPISNFYICQRKPSE